MAPVRSYPGRSPSRRRTMSTCCRRQDLGATMIEKQAGEASAGTCGEDDRAAGGSQQRPEELTMCRRWRQRPREPARGPMRPARPAANLISAPTGRHRRRAP